MLPSEIPWVLYEGSGDRGPFPLVVDGTPITYADVAHIRVTRFDEDGVATVLVEGTDYQLSATAALPDLNDVSRPVTAASFTLKVVQPVLDEGEYVLAERIAPADQSLSYTQAGGFSSSASERNLDAIVRVIQQISTSISRGIFGNRLDDIPATPLELPRVADRASKFFTFDADGNPAAISASPGLGDMLAGNNLSDLDDPATARNNLGLGSASTYADTAFFKTSNNLSEGNASTMRANLGIYSTTQVDALLVAHVALSDPHTQYVLESAYTAADVLAKLLTVDGASSGLDADLLDGLSSAAFGQLAVAGTWAANQIFSGSDANVVTFYRSGAAAKTRWIESTNNNYHGIRNNANTLTFDYNGTDYLTISSAGSITASGLFYSRSAFAAIGVLSSTGGSGFGIRFSNTGAASDSVLLQGTVNSFTGAVSIANIIPSTGAITWSGVQTFSGNVKWGNTSQGTLTYAGSNAYIDSSGAIFLRPASGDLLVVTETALVDRGSAGASLLYVGGANNQGTNIVVRANAGYSRGIIFGTGASSTRWSIECESTAESGSNAGSNFAISAWTDAGAFSSTPFYISRASGCVSLLAAAMGGPINMKSYTVAGMPAGSAGDVVYASNGRKNGEGAGAGTGVLVFKDGTAWRACDTGATVAA